MTLNVAHDYRNAAKTALFLLGLYLCGLSVAHAQESDLAPVADILASIRAKNDDEKTRDALQDFGIVQRALRIWLEKQLPASSDQLAIAEKSINATLDANHLLDPGLEDQRGYLGKVSLSMLGGGKYILARTATGIMCSVAETAYLYEKAPMGWRLVFQSEPEQPSQETFRPQILMSVKLLPAHPQADHQLPRIVTLGHSWTCAGFWQDVYLRLWHLSPSEVSPSPLLTTRDIFYIEPMPSVGVTSQNIVLRFHGEKPDDPGMWTPVVRRYHIAKDDKVTITRPR